MVLQAAAVVAVDGGHLPAECRPVAGVMAVRLAADGRPPEVHPAECRPAECRLAECRPVAVVTEVPRAADGSRPAVEATAVRPVAAGNPLVVRPAVEATAVRPVAAGNLLVVHPAERRPVAMALRPAVMAVRQATVRHPVDSVAVSRRRPAACRPNSAPHRPSRAEP